MPISPWFLGMTRPIWSVQQFQDPSSFGGISSPLGIAGATITLHAKITDSTGAPTGSDLTGTGAVNITDGPNGKFTYTPAATDFFVVTAGIYVCQWQFNFGGGQIIWSDAFTLEARSTF